MPITSDNFLAMTRQLRLYVPDLPVTLAQKFIRDRYRRVLEMRPWSGLRAESQFLLQPWTTTPGTVTVTNNSTTVVGDSTTFDSGMVGLQFKAGLGSPVYTITAVADATHLTLDMPWALVTASAQSYIIFTGYVTPPDDFKWFLVAVDPQQGWRMHHWVTQDELLSWDPQRNFFGQPYCLVDRRFSSSGISGLTAGVPQYEAWPYSSSTRMIWYLYIKQGTDLVNDTDVPIWPIRSDIIVYGALADASRWPGTREAPNPWFARPDIWKGYEGQFQDTLVEIERQDEDTYMTWLAGTDFGSYPFAPLSAAFIQQHAI